MEEPVATTDTTCEPHTLPPHKHLSKLHPHQQHHFHFPPVTFHNLAQKMKTKAPWHKKQQNTELAPLCPETDIRETNLAYHIEIAVPGVKDKESLVIQWMSPRTLIVQGNLTRPDVGFGKPAEGERQWEGENDGWATEARNPPMDVVEEEQDGGKLQRVPSIDKEAQEHDVPVFILNERKAGVFQRTFTLPIDVDMKGLKAKLDTGLLRIDLPKRDMSGEPRMKVEIV
jgi:HSP20 family molecular chaperone IbpA